MSRKTLSVLIFLLLMCMLFQACAGESQNTTVTESLPSQTTSVPKRENTPDNLPDNLSFNGLELKIYYATYDNNFNNKFYDAEGDPTYDYVSKAVYERNRKVEDRLKLKLTFELGSPTSANALATEVAKMYMSWDQTYDIILHRAYNAAQQSLQGYFMNLSDAPYIDYSQPWWFYDQIISTSINSNKFFMLQGDLLISDYMNTTAMFYNRALYKNNLGNPDELYQIVLDGKWTYDVFTKYCKDIYQDLSGDGKTEDDILGAHFESNRTGEYYPYTSGLQLSLRDEQGYPVLNYNNEKVVTMVEKLYDFMYNNEGVMSLSRDKVRSKFMNDELLFYAYFLSLASSELINMDSDYGIIPFPKLEESLEYTSIVLKGAGVVVIPVTIKDNHFDAACAAIEALCAESYRSVIPSFYENMLKIRYVRDEISAQMIDLISASIRTDFTYWMGASINNIHNIFSNLLYGSASNAFKSTYDKAETTYLTALQSIISQFENLS